MAGKKKKQPAKKTDAPAGRPYQQKRTSKKPAVPPVTYNSLHVETGADRHCIKRWLAAEGIDPAKDAQAARDCIARHRMPQRKPVTNGGGPEVFDPKSGLPWQVAKMREETLELRRQNEIADKLASREWMPSAVHHQILGQYGEKLNMAPGKLASRLGLNESQKLIIQQELDAMREDAAEAIEKMDFEKFEPEKPEAKEE